MLSKCFSTQITDPDATFLPEPEARVQRLSEFCFSRVQQLHAVWHLVERQRSLFKLQVNADPVMTGRSCELDAVTIMADRIAWKTVKTPGVCVAPKSRHWSERFSLYPSVGQGNLSLVSVHLYLIVAPLRLQPLPAQHLPPVDEPLGVANGRAPTFEGGQPNLFVSCRNDQILVSCGRVQAEGTGIWVDQRRTKWD